MSYRTLISSEQLRELDQGCIIVDCRFSLADSTLGRQQYEAGHIPGAFFLDLNQDLSSPLSEGSGRHPLPSPDRLQDTLRGIGLSEHSQLVAYDDQGGAFAGRLWWLCQWLGHTAAAVLDGGLPAWEGSGGALETQSNTQAGTAGSFTARARSELLLTADELLQTLGNSEITLVDARGAERYRGDSEPIDPVAGHVPGAVNTPFVDNLTAAGLFKPVAELRQRHERTGETIHMCGSGVTACHNILASVHAGLDMPRLYAGSWSEWVQDSSRPVTTG